MIPSATRDRRYSIATKVGTTAQGAAFMTVLREAILGACKEGRTSRLAISIKLGVPPKTLEKWLSPGETLSPRFDHVLTLLDPDGPLPRKHRERVYAWLAREQGRVDVSIVDADPELSPVPVQVAQIFAAGGRVAAMVAVMTAPDSEGGYELTPAEAAAILPVARDEQREASELVATLERIAGGRLDVMG